MEWNQILFRFILVCYFVTTGCKNKVVDPNSGVLSDAKSILSFVFEACSIEGGVDQLEKRISLYIPEGVDMTSLVPTITISEKAVVSPPSGAANDFSNPTIYTVTAEDGSSQDYTVTVYRKSQYVDVTFIANAGFLISTPNKKILIDAIFSDADGAPDGETLVQMREARHPFDDVDLVFVTHNHGDHCSAFYIGRHLTNNAEACLICPQDVYTEVETEYIDFELIRERILPITPNGTWANRTFHEINVKILDLYHAGDHSDIIQNNGYIVNLEGIKVFHIGDAAGILDNFDPYPWLVDEGICVLLIPEWFALEEPHGVQIVNERIQPDHVVLMHIHPSRMEYIIQITPEINSMFPSVTYFTRCMETMRFE